jgi:alanyl-tRNA synthetase
MMRGDGDLEEKFSYICRNPWDSGVVLLSENYPWLWTPDEKGSAARDARQGDRDGRAPQEIGDSALKQQVQIDVAFRVIADHIRTLSFSIADGILPGNNDRNYVLRRILRRAVRYGRTLGFHEPFFYKLVEVLAEKMGDVFPELRKKQSHVQEVIKTEEEAFNKTLDRGIDMFEEFVQAANEPVVPGTFRRQIGAPRTSPDGTLVQETYVTVRKTGRGTERTISGEFAFKLYDTYGFPLDLTELMARERGC